MAFNERFAVLCSKVTPIVERDMELQDTKAETDTERSRDEETETKTKALNIGFRVVSRPSLENSKSAVACRPTNNAMGLSRIN